MPELVCIARFKAKKNMSSHLIKSLEDVVLLTKNEDGCLLYDLCTEDYYSGAYGEIWDVCLVERWKSRKYFYNHRNTDYFKYFFNVTALPLIECSDIRLYTPQ